METVGDGQKKTIAKSLISRDSKRITELEGTQSEELMKSNKLPCLRTKGIEKVIKKWI